MREALIVEMSFFWTRKGLVRIHDVLEKPCALPTDSFWMVALYEFVKGSSDTTWTFRPWDSQNHVVIFFHHHITLLQLLLRRQGIRLALRQYVHQLCAMRSALPLA